MPGIHGPKLPGQSMEQVILGCPLREIRTEYILDPGLVLEGPAGLQGRELLYRGFFKLVATLVLYEILCDDLNSLQDCYYQGVMSNK